MLYIIGYNKGAEWVSSNGILWWCNIFSKFTSFCIATDPTLLKELKKYFGWYFGCVCVGTELYIWIPILTELMHWTQTNNHLALKLYFPATKSSLVSSRKTSLMPHTTQLAHCPQCAVRTLPAFYNPTCIVLPSNLYATHLQCYPTPSLVSNDKDWSCSWNDASILFQTQDYGQSQNIQWFQTENPYYQVLALPPSKPVSKH